MKSISTSQKQRAVFISDVHLGSIYCHAQELAEFLKNLDAQRLYLVGDIVDLWWMAEKRTVWHQAQNHVVEALHQLVRQGTEIIYVPGNHDRPLRRFCGLMLPQMKIRRRAIHEMLDGRRLLVTHGDDYDGKTHFGGFQEALGDWLYYVILNGNRIMNSIRRRLGKRYWSLADFLKRKSVAAEQYIERFIQAGLDDAKKRGLDGIICGHIHRADMFERNGMVYANDGDWVENLTALIEDADGNLSLINHRGDVISRIESLKKRPAFRLVA
jgi:UDP-2,3-diacylglucosamine pyrophosphatase LpxH